MKNKFLVWFLTLSMLFGQGKKHLFEMSSYEGYAGHIYFTENSPRSLEIKFKLPVPIIGNKLNQILESFEQGPIYYSTQKVKFAKLNDTTYVESFSKGDFEYKFRNNSWILTKYFGKDKYTQELIGKPINGEPLVDAIYDRFYGQNAGITNPFVFARPYRGKVNPPEDYDSYSKTDIFLNEFELYEKGKWIKLKDDPKIMIGNLTTIFDEEGVSSAHLEIKKPSTKLIIERKNN